MRLLVIANCQGPVLIQRFLREACPEFARVFTSFHIVQVHVLTVAERARVGDEIARADVIVAQPVWNSVVPEVTLPVLRDLAASKRLELFPALHYDAIFATAVATKWEPGAGYPFGQTEDMAIAAAFASGLDLAQAMVAWHDVAVLNAATLRAQIEANIRGFETREAEAAVTIPMSDFYRDMWRRDSLHHVRSHPKAVVYDVLSRRLADRLGLVDFDLGRAGKRRGNDQFELPVKRWVHRALDLQFDPDFGRGRLENAVADLAVIFERLWTFYAARGAGTVRARYGKLAPFRTALERYEQVK